MEWTRVKVTTSIEKLDALASVMSMLCNSLQIEDYSDFDENMQNVYGDLVDDTILHADRTKAAVIIYVPEDKNLAEYMAYISAKTSELSIPAAVEVSATDEEEWATAWKKYYKPQKLCNSITVVPSWEEYTPADGEKIITMDPGMAFGTGSHQTTRLCASLAEKFVSAAPGCSVLDVGTGSGILAICAAKSGAGRVCACDIDAIAVRTAAENAERNGVNINPRVSDLLSSVDLSQGKYDIVIANIVADIIIRLSDKVSAYLKKGGAFITSGIIDTREAEVCEALESRGFKTLEIARCEGWSAIVFENQSK